MGRVRLMFMCPRRRLYRLPLGGPSPRRWPSQPSGFVKDCAEASSWSGGMGTGSATTGTPMGTAG